MSKIDEKLKKIKLWQEELKLVMMGFGALSTIGVFLFRLFFGKSSAVRGGHFNLGEFGGSMPDVLKSLPGAHVERIGGAAPKLMMKHPRLYQSPPLPQPTPEIDWIMIGSVVLFVVFILLAVYFIVKILKKRSAEHG